ncbi:conserved hypothetical protein [Pseudomonas sp. 8BK]|nr:conserved hypothetical protein [Pseudomonas sp. 8BK]
MEITVSLKKDEEPIKKSTLLKNSEYSGYFQTKEHELAFYFKINNSAFDKLLGIKRIHMVDVKKANELKKTYLSLFHPDRKKNTNTGLDYNEICADINTTFHRVSGGKL